MFLEFGCEKWIAMVIKVNTYWMCEECGFKYEDKSGLKDVRLGAKNIKVVIWK
jgi:hypothetical protein